MSAATTQPDEDDWLKYKNLIRHEYLVKKTSLKDLVILLRAKGLHTTEGRLEYRLKKLKISRNLDEKTWQYIARKIRKRKDQGKDSDVIHCGRILKKAKVSKETRRHEDLRFLAQFNIPPKSPTNLPLSICTPLAASMSFEWPSSLPWIQLQDMSWNIRVNSTESQNMIVHQSTQVEAVFSSMIYLLTRTTNPGPSFSLSKLIAGLRNLMPECYPDEHIHIAQSLSIGPGAESFTQCFRAMVYMMSNSLSFDDAIPWGTFVSLENIGIIDWRRGFRKPGIKNATIHSFLETMFKNEIELATPVVSGRVEGPQERPLHIIHWLLDLGQNPNQYLFNRHYDKLITPVRKAIMVGNVELVRLLLRFNASLDAQPPGTNCVAVINAALDSHGSDAKKLRLLEFLLDQKLINMDEALRAAIERGDLDLMGRAIQGQVDVTTTETSWRHPMVRRFHANDTYFSQMSSLTMAVEVGGQIASLMLDHVSVQMDAAALISPDVFLAAAYGGDYEVMLRLYNLQPFGAVHNSKGITPLQAAVLGGNLAVCELLLELHGGASTTLLLSAAMVNKVGVLRLLLEYGASSSGLIYKEDIEWHKFFFLPAISLDKQHHLVAILLANQFTRFPTLEREDCIVALIEDGAKITENDFLTLAQNGYSSALETAIIAGVSPNARNEYGSSALQLALTFGLTLKPEQDAEMMKRRYLAVMALLHGGVNLVGGEVVKAIQLKDIDLLMLLLTYGGRLTDSDSDGTSCLEAEITARNDVLLQNVLENQGGGIDSGPLCAALRGKDWDLVQRLLKRDHVGSQRHLLDGTAIGLAAAYGQLDILECLFARFSYHSTLQYALLPFLLDWDNNLPIPLDFNKTTEWTKYRNDYWRLPHCCVVGSPLSLTVFAECITGFSALLERGFRIDGYTWSAIANAERASDFVQALRSYEYQFCKTMLPDTVMIRTPLCMAIRANNDDLLQFLLERKADVNEHDISTPCSLSPLQCAAKRGNEEMVYSLIDSGANVNAPPAFRYGGTALQFSAIGGYMGIASQLIQLGAGINARGACHYGRSALEGAAEHGRLDMLALLIHRGAVTEGDARGQLINAIAYAQTMAHNYVAEWLKEKCGWTDADQVLLENTDVIAGREPTKCLASYCCDEYHESENKCVYYYTDQQRNKHYSGCMLCKTLRNDTDDGTEYTSSNAEGHMNSENDEGRWLA